MEPISSDEHSIEEEAARRGIATSYYDIFGNLHQIQADVLQQILQSIGPDVPQDPLPPTLVLTVGEERELPSSATLFLEDGEVRSVDHLDGSLPPGYHRLTLSGTDVFTYLIICPPRMWVPDGENRKNAGVAISLYGLRSESNWGVGDLRDLRRFVSWTVKEIGAGFVALNPLHALHNRIPYNASPYLPLCSYYRNFLYLDLEAIEEFKAAEIQAQFLSTAVQQELAFLREAEFVEYERSSALKLRFLRLCFERYLKSPHGDFSSYVSDQGELLHQFAVYCALDQYFRETIPDTWIWTQWPESYHSPDTPDSKTFAQEHANDVMFYCWLQWQLDRQLADVQSEALQHGMSIGLYHDLALATDRFGCDLWANRSHFVEGCRVGAPPDGFAPEGQDWAFPPGNGNQHFRDGYKLYIASIRHNATHGGALRLDHVMRLFRLFWIPDGFNARQGTYVYERWRDLLGIMALESHRLKVRIIGEDLGTISDEMREGLAQYGVLGYRLLYFEREPDGQFREPQNYFPAAVAATSTHDLPTLVGFWESRDIEARRSAGLLPDDSSYFHQHDSRNRDKQLLLDRLHQFHLLPEDFPRDATAISHLTMEMQSAILVMLSSTPCELLVINQEDLTFEPLQQNLPGSTSEYPNWRRKMRYTMEELENRDDLVHQWQKVREILKNSERISVT